MTKTNSKWAKILQIFTSSNNLTNFEKVKADIIPMFFKELDNLDKIKIFMGPSSANNELHFTQILLNQKLTLDCTENLINQKYELAIFQEKNCYLKTNMTKMDYHKLLTLLFDFVFLKIQQLGIESLKAELNTNHSGTTLNKIENEQKTREWLKVTMEVFKKALEKVASDQNLLLDFSLQADFKAPEPTIIFKSYNLFWQMKFLENALLRVIFFNDKKAEISNTPSLSGDFYHQKNQIWDEFIKTLTNINQTQSMK